MSEPMYNTGMERLYYGLPEAWRIEDANTNWQLKRYLGGVGVLLGTVEDTIDRINFDPLPDGEPGDTSDLVDPTVADVGWLPWLAQLVGQKVDTPDTALVRTRIASANKFKAGTKAALAEAAKNVLTGEKKVTIFDHSSTAPGDGGEWDLLVITKGSDTLSSPAAEIIRVGAKPAGIVLHETTFEAAWSAIEAALPTWADWDTKSWAEIEEIGL